MVLDPLSAQALCRPRHLSGCSGEDVLGQFSSYIFRFYLFLTLLRNFNSLLHAGTFCLTKGVSLDATNIVFNMAA
jgi:hypothetical protein